VIEAEATVANPVIKILDAVKLVANEAVTAVVAFKAYEALVAVNAYEAVVAVSAFEEVINKLPVIVVPKPVCNSLPLN
jgi:hypothetical protein